MLTLPTIAADVPAAFTTSTRDPVIEQLARVMATAGMFAETDLRTGAAGPWRMIERAFERWAFEDGVVSKMPELPIAFHVISQDGAAWLVLEQTAGSARWYVGNRMKAWIDTPMQPLAELATATIYRALDALCYAPKPPEYLVWASHCWWRGFEDEKAALAAQTERRKDAQTIIDKHVALGAAPKGLFIQQALADEGLEDLLQIPTVRRNTMPTRKRFDHRYPRWMQAPRHDRHALDLVTTKRGHAPNTAAAIEGVEAALRNRNLRRPNMHQYSNGAPDSFGCLVRWKYGDYTGRLIDDWVHAARKKNMEFFDGHGRWPLNTTEDVVAARRAITAHCRLLRATLQLLRQSGWASWNRMGH